MSDHWLHIETGRYKTIPRPQRLCNICNVLEDEEHFLLYCDKYKDFRISLFNKIKDKFDNQFLSLSPLEKIILLLDPKKELLSDIGAFLQQSLALER